MTNPKYKHEVSGSVNRDLPDILNDVKSSKTFGGLSDLATDDTIAINAGIVAMVATYGGGVMLLPEHTRYTEASLVMNSNVVLLDNSRPGKIRILTKSEGSTLPILKGGIEIKSQNKSGVLLRDDDAGVSGSPFLQVLNSATGQVAGLIANFLKLTTFIDILEEPTPTAPPANTARLFTQDNGSGKTQLCVRFNTGAVQTLSTQP